MQLLCQKLFTVNYAIDHSSENPRAYQQVVLNDESTKVYNSVCQILLQQHASYPVYVSTDV